MTDAPGTRSLPTLPLKNSILYPHLVMPLAVGRPVSVATVEAALASEDKTLLIVAQRDASVEEPSRAQLHDVGTLGVIKRMERSDQGIKILVEGLQPARLLEVRQEQPVLDVWVQTIPEPTDEGTDREALQREMLALAARIQAIVAPEAPLGLPQILAQTDNPLHQVYLLASLLGLDVAKGQALLEADTRLAALQLMHDHLVHEVQVLELRQKIAEQAQTEMSKEQREYLLRQQMRAIQEELGEKNPEQAEVAELRRRFDEAQLPEPVRKEADRELRRLERLPTAAADYQVIRSYLELVLELPWTKLTDDMLDIPHARKVLDEDHYDLKEIKERIVEQLAVLKLNPAANAPILCFVGPPGVGKTSLGQSIARSLGRKFERISLGGLHDEAELRGHRRTYIGAMPGRIIQAVRRAGARNPVVMLDEIDKLGSDYRGDPAAALMEILDPAQNVDFRDNYLDLPFDLSKVLFITTANTLDTIPRPLLDRMEVLRLAGYTEEEKQEIAKHYLIPRRLKEAGLTTEQLSIPDDTLERLIRRYTREAGVRELERTLGRLTRKVAARIAENSPGLSPFSESAASNEAAKKGTVPLSPGGSQISSMSFRPQPDDLADLLGPERFFLEEARRELPPGVAAGLAWTEAGGDVLYIEAVLLPEGKDLLLTGQLGEVMQESAKAGRSWVWSQAAELGIDQQQFKASGVHIHVPAGAVPKDGPSAGVTMATALTSLYTQLRVRSDTAMTGEITLTGLVLPVGGIKEKVLAARRAGFQRVILPKENERDLRELPESIREELEFVLAARIEDALAAAIPELAERLAAENAA